MSNAAFILSDETPALLTTGAGEWWARLFGKTKPVVAAQPAYLPLARTGDADALARLYADYKDPVWRLCRRLLRREADAEDVMQSTFVKAFAALPRFRGDAALQTWLFRIAVNEANSLLRCRDAHHATDDATPEPPAATGASDAERVAVRALLATLKPDFRTVLVLRYWEELSYEEISAVLNAPLPAVKMRLHRAKEAFRALYTEDAP